MVTTSQVHKNIILYIIIYIIIYYYIILFTHLIYSLFLKKISFIHLFFLLQFSANLTMQEARYASWYLV